MKTLLAVLLLAATPASAQTSSPDACNTFSTSALNAAAAIDQALDGMSGSAFRAAMPTMPEKVKPAAADVEEARISAVAAMREYTRSMKDFAAKIQNCGN